MEDSIQTIISVIARQNTQRSLKHEQQYTIQLVCSFKQYGCTLNRRECNIETFRIETVCNWQRARWDFNKNHLNLKAHVLELSMAKLTRLKLLKKKEIDE